VSGDNRRIGADPGGSEGQILGRGVKDGGQAALDVGAEQAGAFAGLIQAPALAGHVEPGAGLGLAQPAFAPQGASASPRARTSLSCSKRGMGGK
jgi:hypothetical protein